MRRRILRVAVLLLVVAAVGGGWWWLSGHPAWAGRLKEQADEVLSQVGLRPPPADAALQASGFIEAEEAAVTTEVGGRIVELRVEEGDSVNQGAIVARLDDSLLQAMIEQSRADVAASEAALNQVQAGAREETLAHARALVKQAEAGLQAAQWAWEDVQSMAENPQELTLELVAARGQLRVLEYQVVQAQALANSAQVARNLADEAVRQIEEFEPFMVQVPVAPGIVVKREVKLPITALSEARHQQADATHQSWEAWTGLSQAQAAREGAAAYVRELGRQVAHPLELWAQVDAAEGQVRVAEAAVGVAQAQVDGLKMGATEEQSAAAAAQVQVAQAALEALVVQSDKLTLTAPISGLVLERPFHEGEVAAPGMPLVTLADLDRVTLTVYVSENRLGQVQIGQQVRVKVDAYPDRAFDGAVTTIASEAQFTPKNVQTQEDRVTMVFAVTIALPNLGHELKPGMPADATFVESQERGQ